MSEAVKAASGTQAVDRAALLVSTVVLAEEPLNFADIAERCDLPRSTTSRLLAALERTELLERNEHGGYVAGPVFWLYSLRYDPWEELSSLAHPVLERVGEITGETVNLGIARGDRVVHVAQVDSRYLLAARDWTSVDVPAHTSALGKVLYAYEALRPPTSGLLERTTEHTVGDARQLTAQLATIRRQGYAVTTDELEIGLSGLAVPVFGVRGEVLAAMGISGPTARFEGRVTEMTRLLMEQAEQLSRLLRHRTRKEGVA
ncbi:IclR family transcriptional regulator [Actinomycetota bacterium]